MQPEMYYQSFEPKTQLYTKLKFYDEWNLLNIERDNMLINTSPQDKE